MQTNDWYVIEDVGDGITIIQEQLRNEDVKSFLIEGTRDVAVLDTGMGVGDFAALVARLSDKEPLVLQSHAHWDHIGASHLFRRVYVHPDEADDLRHGEPNEGFRELFGPGKIEFERLPAGFDPQTAFIPGTDPTGWLREGDTFDLGGRVLEVFHTPGHTPGDVSILDRTSRTLFCGDAVNLGQLYIFEPSSDPAAWRASLQKLVDHSAQVDIVRPSHGPPITHADIYEIQGAYEEVWVGKRQPDDQQSADIGYDEPATYDVFRFERFEFMLATGRYGER